MKRNNLAAAVIAGVAGVAGLANVSTAVNLNPDGLGEVLIYPYYTVNGGNDTLISVVNTTDEVKAVKVRVIEAQNSDEVLDFNLYLSPFDVWTAALTSNGDTGAGILTTDDTSCTVPAIPAGGVSFSNALFDDRIRGDIDGDGNPLDNPGDDDQSLERTREGYLELIEMGVVDEEVDDFTGVAADNEGLEAAAIHGAAVDAPPADCDRLVAAWTSGFGGEPNGIWVDTPGYDVREPTGGLFGGGWIINVPGAWMVTYNADALDAFYNPATNEDGTAATLDASDRDLHQFPGDQLPTLNQVDPANSIVFDNGAVVTSAWGDTVADPEASPIDAVSAVFMHNEIYNEYITGSGLGAMTSWVVTFPTKQFYVNQDNDVEGVRPFQSIWDGETSCDTIALNYFNREEDEATGAGVTEGPCFSPCTITEPTNVGRSLCYEANVIGFNDTNMFASPLVRNIDTDQVDAGGNIQASFEAGWAIVGFPAIDDDDGDGLAIGADPADRHVLVSDGGDTYIGLPVTGFSAIAIRNDTQCVDADGEVVTCADGLDQVFASYAGLFEHRADRQITDVTP